MNDILSASQKLGVKFLDDQQLDSIFPDWRSLMDRVEVHRNIVALSKSDQMMKFDSPQTSAPVQDYHMQLYDNVYSILGGRGTGKSCIIQTLRAKMRQENPQDIFLPIITPDVISGKSCSILGWVLSATEGILDELERRAKSVAQQPHGIYIGDPCYEETFFEDCKFRKRSRIRERYDEILRSCLGSNGNGSSDYYLEDAVGYQIEQSKQQYRLMQDLNQFWGDFSDLWKKTNQLCRCPGGEKEPLILLIFDDIDLAPERTMELLTTTFQYFAALNIVIIITAAEQVLKDVIQLRMLERMLGSKSPSLLQDVSAWTRSGALDQPVDETRNRHLYHQINRMSREFYDKVLPPSSRYYLSRYPSIDRKAEYAYSRQEQSFRLPEKTLSIKLEDFLLQQMDELRALLIEHHVPEEECPNFLRSGDSFCRAYLIIFGQKSRNIATGCLEIMSTLGRIKQIIAENGKKWSLDEMNSPKVMAALKHMTKSLILARGDILSARTEGGEEYLDENDLKPFSERLDEFIHWDRNRANPKCKHQIYVDYSAVRNLYRERQSGHRRRILQRLQDASLNNGVIDHQRAEWLRKEKSKFCVLMSVLFFAESIIYMLDSKQRKRVHGYQELSTILNSDIVRVDYWDEKKSFKLFPQTWRTSEFLEKFPHVLEQAERYVDINPYRDSAVREEYLFDVLSTENSKEPLSLLNRCIDEDADWVRTVLTLLTFESSGLAYINKDFVHIQKNYRDLLKLFPFGRDFLQKIEQATIDFLAKAKLEDSTETEFDELNKILQHQPQEKKYPAAFPKAIHNNWYLLNDAFRTCSTTNTSEWNEYIKGYFYSREKDENAIQIQTGSQLERNYRLIQFYEKHMQDFFTQLAKTASLFLEKDEIEYIKNCLHSMPIYVFQELHRAGILFENSLDTAEEISVPQKPNPAGTPSRGNSGPSERTGDSEKTYYRLPAKAFIEYMQTHSRITGNYLSAKSMDVQKQFYLFEGARIFNMLIPYLNLYVKSGSSLSSDLEQDFQWFGSELKMLEFLAPYHLAAMTNVMMERKDMGQAALTQDLHDMCTRVDLGNTPRLQAIMEQARQELAQQYMSYLESEDDG